MSDQIRNFGETATRLAHNPIGIIALFIVLVYGFASLVMIFARDFATTERLPLVYFLILFPILVLIVFAWLVSKHNDKLYGPGDFENQSHFIELLKMQALKTANMASALGAAQAKRTKNPTTGADMREIIDLVWGAYLARPEHSDPWRKKILWVDDQPENNTYERQAFEAMDLRFTLALSTGDAFEKLERSRYAAIISDMERPEGPKEGYVLLDKLRQERDLTPLFFYTSSNAPEHRQEALEHGGQGSTNDPQELIEMVTRAVIES